MPVPDTALDRNFYTTSSCGVCGKASIDAIRTRTRFDVAADGTRVELSTLLALPDRLRAAQEVFEKTGGLHAAGLFTADGELVALREDVGRHNAVDKVIGTACGPGGCRWPATCSWSAGAPASSSPRRRRWPASRAGRGVGAQLAGRRAGRLHRLTLVGFLRGDGCNVYSGTDRLVVPAA